jgi:hypothetical protein
VTPGLSDEERSLLAGGESATANSQPKQTLAPEHSPIEGPRGRRRKGETPEPAEVAKSDQEAGKKGESARGELSPAQFDDDGWGGLPVQMRG